MKYQQPYGIQDANASYYNGVPGKRLGSIPPALAFEQPMRELVSAIANSGISPSDVDLTQFVKAIRSGRLNYLVDTGTVNALVGTPLLPLDAYNAGLPIRIKVANTNTGPVTLNVSNRGAVSVVKGNGSTLSAGDIIGGQILEVVHDGVNFQIVNFLGLSAGTTTNNFYKLNLPYVVDTGTTNNLIGPYSPVISTLTAGLLISIRIINAITGPTTITVNSNPTKAVTHGDGTPLANGNAAVGQILLLVYDGVKFQLTGEGGITPTEVVKFATFPWAQYNNSASFLPDTVNYAEWPRPLCPWAAGTGDPNIIPAFNLSNGMFTVPVGYGGNWLFQCALLSGHCTDPLHVSPSPVYQGARPQQSIRFFKGAVPPKRPGISYNGIPLQDNLFMVGNAAAVLPRLQQDAGVCANAVGMIHLLDGETIQVAGTTIDSDVVWTRFTFTAIRLGKSS